MAPTIVRESGAHFHFGVSPGGTIVDIACDIWAFELGSDTEEIDIGTFCDPSASDQGRTTYTAVLSLLWSPALYTKLLPHVGEECGFAWVPDLTDIATAITFHTRYSAMPWGRFEIGQRVEVELPLAVLGPIEYGDTTAAMARISAEIAASQEAAAQETQPATDQPAA